MNKKLRKTLKTIILAAIFYLIAICLPLGWVKNSFYALAYVVSGFAVIKTYNYLSIIQRFYCAHHSVLMIFIITYCHYSDHQRYFGTY